MTPELSAQEIRSLLRRLGITENYVGFPCTVRAALFGRPGAPPADHQADLSGCGAALPHDPAACGAQHPHSFRHSLEEEPSAAPRTGGISAGPQAQQRQLSGDSHGGLRGGERLNSTPQRTPHQAGVTSSCPVF